MAVLTGVHPRPWWKLLNANKKQLKNSAEFVFDLRLCTSSVSYLFGFYVYNYIYSIVHMFLLVN